MANAGKGKGYFQPRNRSPFTFFLSLSNTQEQSDFELFKVLANFKKTVV